MERGFSYSCYLYEIRFKFGPIHDVHIYIQIQLLKPSYYCCTWVRSYCWGQNQSTAFFDRWPKCAHRGIFDCFLLSFWPLDLNNTRQCFYQSKTVDSFWPVNVLTTRKVWQCLTFKCTRYTLGSIYKFLLILTLVVRGGLITFFTSINLIFKVK